MLGEPLMLVPGLIALILAYRYGLIAPIWNGMVSGLRWLVVPRDRLTWQQKHFNTNMKWHEVRWSIARLEHELIEKDFWCHSEDDCVHPDCNPGFLKRIMTLDGREVMMKVPPAPNSHHKRTAVPILPAPPPPPPPKRSKGGPTTYDKGGLSYTCLTCGMTSYNPNDIANQYCGNCHEYKTPF